MGFRLGGGFSVLLLLACFTLACAREEAPAPPVPGEPSPEATPGQPAAPVPPPEVPAPETAKPGPAPPTPEQEKLRSIGAIPSRAEDPDQALTELQPWLSDQDRDVREAALLALWDIETEGANKALAQVARTDSDSDIKMYAVEELLDREAPEALDALLHLLNDPDVDLREQAAEGIETLEDAKAVPELYKALEGEKDEWVRDAIISALESLDPSFDEEAYEE